LLGKKNTSILENPFFFPGVEVRATILQRDIFEKVLFFEVLVFLKNGAQVGFSVHRESLTPIPERIITGVYQDACYSLSNRLVQGSPEKKQALFNEQVVACARATLVVERISWDDTPPTLTFSEDGKIESVAFRVSGSGRTVRVHIPSMEVVR
jgi:hypothetical protein